MTGDRPDIPEDDVPAAPAGGDAQTLILSEIRRIARAQERMETRLDDRLTRLERRLDDFEAVADGSDAADGGPGPSAEAGAAPGGLAAVTAGAPRSDAFRSDTATVRPDADLGERSRTDPAAVRPGSEPDGRSGRKGRGAGTVLAWLIVLVAVLATAGWWAQTTGRLAPLTERVRGLLVAEESPPVAEGPVTVETVDETPDAAEARQDQAVPAPTEGGIAVGVAEDTDVAPPGEAEPDGALEAGADPGPGADPEETDAAPSLDAPAAGETDPSATAGQASGDGDAPDDAGPPVDGDGGGEAGGDEGAAATADAGDEVPAAAPSTDSEATPAISSTRPTATPEPPPGQPQVAAVPPEPVEAADLQQVAAARAPLPADAPADLRELAGLALEGRPEAQHDLATAYALGEAVPRDYELAAYWYRRSADSGVANALYNLGVLTERGLGVEQDSAAAFDLFLAAAEEGHPDAQNAVGLAYSAGRGVEQDLFKAASWFQAASASGNPRGAYHMGRLFERGLDGAPDENAAAGWYRIAAQEGDADAEAALARVTGSGDASGGEAIGAAAEPSAGEAAVPVPDSTPEPVASGPAAPAEEPLTAAEIEDLQRLLNEAGYDAGPVDGLMGERTRTAIGDWQQANGLPRTEEPSRRLLERLRSG